MPRLRITAGPNFHDLTEIKPNTRKGFSVSTDAFEGEVAVFIKGFTTEDEDAEVLSYFEEAEREGKTWSIQFQGETGCVVMSAQGSDLHRGRFLQPHTADDILVGAAFDRPLTLPWGFSVVTSFMQ